MLGEKTDLSQGCKGELSLELAYQALEVLPAGVYVTDQAGRIVYYNSRAAEMWGRQPAIGELWCGSWKILRSDGSVLPHDECPMAITVKTQEPTLGYEIVVERPDGTQALVAPNPRPIRNAEGEFVGAINMLVDITCQREAEAARKSAEEDAQRVSQELSHQYAVTQVLAEASCLEEAAARILELLCNALGAAVGSLWMPNGRVTLQPLAVFGADKQLRSKYESICSDFPFTIGKDVPTRVLTSRRMTSIDLEQAEETPRRNALLEAGFCRELVFPVQLNGEANVRGVLKFLFTERSAKDLAGMKLVAETALKLGAFVDRLDMERALWENDKRLEGFPLS